MKLHLLITVLALAACGKQDEQATETLNGSTSAGSSATTSTSKAAFEARRVFQTLCATCHGPRGQGDGQAAAGLDPKPRNYTDKAWQASVTDADLRNIIMFGGQAIGKSAVMPGAPQLKGQPEVIDELIKIIRGFGK